MLWHALDHDSSGVTTIEELDPSSARLLAQFKQWSEAKWGLKCSQIVFRVLDRQRSRKLKYADFAKECKALGFVGKAKTLASWLDWQDKKHIVEEDLVIFDVWRPPAYLCANPNPEAADEFREALQVKYKHFLKAWRLCLDQNNSNVCNWYEFLEAAKR